MKSNTQYTVQIQIFEASCSYTAPAPGTAFTTTPVDPTSFTLSAASPFSLNASWATGTNPGGTIYQAQYCTNLAFTQNCNTKNSGAGATSTTLTTGVNPSTTYFAHVKALTIGGGSDSGYSTSASAFTPPNVQSITINPSTPQTVVTGNTLNFTATVTDPSGNVIPGQAVNWAISGGGSLSQTNGSGTTFTATTPGNGFILTASSSGYSDATNTINVVAAGPVFDSLNFTMSAGNKGGTATAVGHDNVAHSINHSWSASDSLITFTPATGTSADGVAFNTAVVFDKAGTFTLTDSLGSGVSSSTVVTVPPILSGLKVCAMSDATCAGQITLKTLQTQQFMATGVDQFGNSMTLNSVVWSNNVNGSGAQASFSSGASGQTVRITATSSNQSGFIMVNVVNFDVSGAKAFPVPYKANQGNGIIHFSGLGNQSTIHIYTTSGRRVFDIQLNSDTYDWPIKNSSGESIASGVYFYVIESPQGKKNGKLIIIQ